MDLGLPPPLHERVVCSIAAATKYGIPVNVMLAVAEQEGGRPGQWSRNTNGSHDVGAMQFNTTYLADLGRYGITPSAVAAAGCYAYDLAAWRLRMHIRNDAGMFWTRVANYHSRTPRHNAVYRAKLLPRAAKWADWLDARFVTRNLGHMVTHQSGVSAPSRPELAASLRLQTGTSTAASLQRTHP